MNELVVLESPFAGNTRLNTKYAKQCMRDCFARKEFPLASHLLYAQKGVLNDKIPEQRILGIMAGLAWAKNASKTVVYTDLGISKGMEKGICAAQLRSRPVEFRKLKGWKK